MTAIKQHMHLGTHGVYSFTNTTGDSGDTKLSVIRVETKNKQGDVVTWGSDNTRPQKIMEAIKKNGTAKAGLSVNKKLHYGGGFIMYKEQTNDSGKIVPQPQSLSKYPEIRDFFRKSKMTRFWKEKIADLETFYIAFPEYILSVDYNNITRVRRQKASWCRFEEQQENGLIENVWISQKWGLGGAVNRDSEYVEVVPVIDSYWSAEEVKEYCKVNKIEKFIRPIAYTMIDEAYYPVADWHTSIDNGWIDVANSIPEYKKAMFDNQISIKYLVEIDERYFEKIYGRDWDEFTVDRRKKERQTIIDLIDEHLGGNENAGKTIQSMRLDIGDDKTVPAITITAIDDKFKEGAYLPEASAANSEILFPMNVDPTLIGAGIPGGKLGAGSGSDKREAFLIASSLFKTNRETTLDTFSFIQEYNGWDPDLIPAFQDTKLTTLDENPTGSEKIVV